MRILFGLLCLGLMACGSQQSTPEKEKNSQELTVGKETISIEEKSFFDGKMEMLFPSNFELMDEDMKLAKYDKNNLPTYVFTNNDNSVNLVINFTEAPSSLAQLPEYDEIFSRRLGINGVITYKTEIEQINNRDFLVLEFQTPGEGIPVYNYMALGVLEDRLFMATFNCWVEAKKDWMTTGRKMIESIRFPKEI